MPRPGTPMIHPRFAEHLQPTAELAMQATITIRRPGTAAGTFNAATGKTTPPTSTLIWTGPARVQPLVNAASRPIDFGGQQISLHRYQVSTPADIPQVAVDDQITVDGGADDPELAGQTLRVIDVPYASVLLQRDLICEHNLG